MPETRQGAGARPGVRHGNAPAANGRAARDDDGVNRREDLGGAPLASGRAARADIRARGIPCSATAPSDSLRRGSKRGDATKFSFSHVMGPNVADNRRDMAGEAGYGPSG